MKKITAIVGVAAVLGLCIMACRSNTNKNTGTAQSESSADKSTGNLEVGPMDVTYFKFKEFNTRMVIPEAWMDYVSIKKSSVGNGDGAMAEYDAIFTGSSEKENEFLGAIYIFSQKGWNAIPADSKGIYVKVKEIDGNVYAYKSNQSNPYDAASPMGKEFDLHMITMDKAPHIIVIEKEFPYTVKLDEAQWDIIPSVEGGIDAQNKAGITLSLGTSTGASRGLNSLADVKKNIIDVDKTAKLLASPTKVGGYDAICYESNTFDNIGMEYACAAYIKTGDNDLKLLIVGGKKDQAEQIKAAFNEACTNFTKKANG